MNYTVWNAFSNPKLYYGLLKSKSLFHDENTDNQIL